MKKIEYQFKNLPLTAAIGKKLILEFYNGKLETRKSIISEVTAAHIERGGKKTNAADNTRMLKTALSKLKKEGMAENPSQGYWKIGAIEVTEVNDLIEITQGSDNRSNESYRNNIENPNIGTSQEIKEENNLEIVLGKGKSTVYLYYLPHYKNNGGIETWPCKIGRTDGDPLERINAQASTALPEKPIIAVIIKTDNSQTLEQAIHNILTYRNKKVETAIGKEWFDTNPEEFLKIVQFIEQSTLLF